MKKNLFIKLLAPALMVSGSGFLFSCNTVDDGDYVPPFTQYEKISGQWAINSVTQTDEAANKKMTLTDLFNFKSFGIQLSVDDDNNPTTYQISGTAPALIPTSGTWKMANAFVNSDGSAPQMILNDDVYLTVSGVPGSKRELEFKLTRTQNGKPFVSYTYNLAEVENVPSTPAETPNE
mgnify:FL=1